MQILNANPLSYSIRAVRWSPLGIAALISTAAVIARRDGDAAAPLQATSIFLASAVGFAFDDPAAEMLDASPTSLLRRRARRIATLIAPVIALWTMLVWVQGPRDAAEAWALITMFAGLTGLSLAIAGVTARASAKNRGGIAVGPSLLVALITSTLFPPRWRPLPMGDIPGGWPAIYLRWSLAAMVGTVAFLWSSRDRARRL